jgi:hypothetical protein
VITNSVSGSGSRRVGSRRTPSEKIVGRRSPRWRWSSCQLVRRFAGFNQYDRAGCGVDRNHARVDVVSVLSEDPTCSGVVADAGEHLTGGGDALRGQPVEVAQDCGVCLLGIFGVDVLCSGFGRVGTNATVATRAMNISAATPKNGPRQLMLPSSPPSSGPTAMPRPSAVSYRMIAPAKPPLAEATMTARLVAMNRALPRPSRRGNRQCRRSSPTCRRARRTRRSGSGLRPVCAWRRCGWISSRLPASRPRSRPDSW